MSDSEGVESKDKPPIPEELVGVVTCISRAEEHGKVKYAFSGIGNSSKLNVSVTSFSTMELYSLLVGCSMVGTFPMGN